MPNDPLEFGAGLSLAGIGFGGINSQKDSAYRADAAVSDAAQALQSVREATSSRIDSIAADCRAILAECRACVEGSIDRRLDAIVPIVESCRQKVAQHLDASIEQAGAYLTGLYRQFEPPPSLLSGNDLIEHVLNSAGLTGPVVSPAAAVHSIGTGDDTGGSGGEPIFVDPPVYVPPISKLPPLSSGTDTGGEITPPATTDPCPGGKCGSVVVVSPEEEDLSQCKVSWARSIYDVQYNSDVKRNVWVRADGATPYNVGKTYPVVDTSESADNYPTFFAAYDLGCGAGGSDSPPTTTPPTAGSDCKLSCPPGYEPAHPTDPFGDPIEPDEPLCGVNDPGNWNFDGEQFEYCGPPAVDPCDKSSANGDGGTKLPPDNGGTKLPPESGLPPECFEENPPDYCSIGPQSRGMPIDESGDIDIGDLEEPPAEPTGDWPPVWAQPDQQCAAQPAPDVPAIPVRQPETAVDGCDPAKWREARDLFVRPVAEGAWDSAGAQLRWGYEQARAKIKELDLGWLATGLMIVFAGLFFVISILIFAIRRLVSSILPQACPPNSRRDYYSTALIMATVTDSMFSIQTVAEKSALHQSVNYSCQVNPLSTSAATAARLSGQMNKDEWEFACKINGDCIPWFERAYKASLPAISAKDSMALFRADLIGQEQYDKLMARHGFTPDVDKYLFEYVSESIPNPETCVRWMNDGIGDEEMAATFGLDQGFSEAWNGKLKEWAQRGGFTEEVARYHWRAQNRTDISPGVVRQGYVFGVITSEDLPTWLNRTGVGPRDSEKLAEVMRKSTRLQRARVNGKLSPMQLWRLVVQGGIDYDAYKAGLLSIDYTEQEAQTARENAQTFTEGLDRKEVLVYLRRGYFQGRFDGEEYLQKLIQAGVEFSRAVQITERDESIYEAKDKEIAAGKLCHYLSQHLITMDEYLRRLKNMGYSIDDSLLMTQSCDLEIREKLRKEREAEDRARVQKAEKEAKALEKLNKEVRTRFFRHVKVRPRPKEIAPVNFPFPDGFGGDGVS